MSNNVVLVFQADDTALTDIENYIQKHGYEVKKVNNKPKYGEKDIVDFAEHYRFDMRTKETFYKNEKIKLTKKESLFLKLLLLNMGHIVTFEQAIDYIWNPEESITENNLRTLVWRVRSKLKTDIIQNNQGIGYYIPNS